MPSTLKEHAYYTLLHKSEFFVLPAAPAWKKLIFQTQAAYTGVLAQRGYKRASHKQIALMASHDYENRRLPVSQKLSNPIFAYPQAPLSSVPQGSFSIRSSAKKGETSTRLGLELITPGRSRSDAHLTSTFTLTLHSCLILEQRLCEPGCSISALSLYAFFIASLRNMTG